MTKLRFYKIIYFLLAVMPFNGMIAQPINRQELVERHTVVNTKYDSLSSLTVGNGAFAFTVDITGLQSFPDAYAQGVPLGTQSEWGWHSFPNVANHQFEDALKPYDLNGRDRTYAVQWNTPPKHKNAADYFRQNLHRLQLANIGLEFLRKDGTLYAITELAAIKQTLNMWKGEVRSTFTVDEVPVTVITYCSQVEDVIAFKLSSRLLAQKRIRIRLRLPYPTGNWSDMGNNWANENRHSSKIISRGATRAVFQHNLDTTSYFISTAWKGNASIRENAPHYFILSPAGGNEFEASFRFDEKKNSAPVAAYPAIRANSHLLWPAFWKSGGAVDFKGSKDTRAAELERRIILSQYLTRVQCAGDNPPQETGLTYNSWFGKPHMEMHWWHSVHFGLWGHTGIMEKSLSWYSRAAKIAKEIAARQGYQGVRWQKMTDNDGREVPSSIGAFLVWQQPHFIYFTELAYRNNGNAKTLEKYKDLVFATADFMASFPQLDSVMNRYILGKGVIAAQERFKAVETFNPTYELVYWHWALSVAQQWKERLGLSRDKKWDEVLQKLSALPIQDNKYLFTESATDSYTNPEFKTDHPSVFGALGMLPKTSLVDTTIMQNTFHWIWNNWSWQDTWGWDFPMTAMTATRLGLSEKAIDALLMPVMTNTYLNNGHNYQDKRLTIYLPGNGGLLAAVALMCAGYDGCTEPNPGIPKNGQWTVKWEGLKKMF